MSENSPNQNISDDDEVSQEELASAKDVIQSILKASKAARMYLPNNPLHRKFFDQLKETLHAFLEEYGEFKVDIGQFELRYEGKNIYENKDVKDSFAFKLYSDGMTALTFSEGIEGDEIKKFLDILAVESGGEVDDDIVTRLWASDLPHVTYAVADEFLEAGEGGIGERTEMETTQKENIKTLSREVQSPEAEQVQQPMMIPQKILSINDEEMKNLKEDRELEEKKNPVEEVTYILYAILAAEKDVNIFREFSSIVVSLIRDLIVSGDVSYVIGFIKFLTKLSKEEGFPEEHWKILFGGLQGVITDDILDDLDRIISEDKVKPDQLKFLVFYLGKNSVTTLCKLLGVTKKRATRETLVGILAEPGKGAVPLLLPFLKDNRWYVVRNIICILKGIGDASALDKVGELASHNELRVRKEVLLYLKDVSDKRTFDHLLKFLNDESSTLRTRALKALAGSGRGDLTDIIISFTGSDDFEEKELSERVAAFEAIGALGSDSAVPMFKEMLGKKYLLNKAKERESVICAVSGLRKVHSETALQAIKEAGASKKGEARDIIDQAVLALGGK